MEDFGALAAYVVFFVLPIVFAHLRGRRWWVWVVPCLVFGPFTLPFIAMRTKPNSNSEQVAQDRTIIEESSIGEQSKEPSTTSEKLSEESRRYSRLELGLICWLLGLLGVHRFLIGRWKTGLLMLLTFGAFGIWTLIDLIRIIINKFSYDFAGSALNEVTPSTQLQAENIYEPITPILQDGVLGIVSEVNNDALTIEHVASEVIKEPEAETTYSDTQQLNGKNDFNDILTGQEVDEVIEEHETEGNSKGASFALGMKFAFSGARKAKNNRKRLVELHNYIEHTKQTETSLRNEFSQVLASRGLDATTESVLFETGNCYLIEVRKGARVTHRESSSSGSGGGASVGFGGVRVGGGSYGSSSSSTTISYPAPDVLKIIDQGKFIITNRKVSFVGGMFTKTTPFLKIVDYQISNDQLLIAPVTGSKVWICEFPRTEYTWLVNILVGAAMDTDNRTLDSKVVTIYETATSLVNSEFNRQCMEIQLAIESFEEDIDKVQIQFSELEETFGSLNSWKRHKFV